MVGLDRHKVHGRRANEARDKGAGRLLVDIERCADLFYGTGVHDDKDISERHSLKLVMGNIDTGHAQLPLQVLDFNAHLATKLGIEIGKRLIEKEHFRAADNGTAHGDALTLTARKFLRTTFQKLSEFKDLSCIFYTFVDLILWHATIAQAIGHVVIDLHVRVERIVLEYHCDVPLGRSELIDHLVVDFNCAVGDRLQTRDHTQQGRLSAARRTDQHAQRTILYGNVDAFDRFDGATIDLANIGQFYICHIGIISPFRPNRARTSVA